MHKSLAKFLIITAAAALPGLASGPYVLGGLAGSISGDNSYGWDGSKNTAFIAAIQNSANFGPSGTVTTPVTSVVITDTGNLGNIKGLVIPWWYNSSATATQVNQVRAFFNAGGDLLLAEDDTSNDPVGINLGIPVTIASSSPWTAANLLSTGPFGPVTGFNSYYSISAFTASTISTLGGTVGATDGSGNVTAAYWPKGTFCPTCGALVMEGDIDVWATGAVFTPSLNSNGQFSLNMIAYMVQHSGNYAGSPSVPPTPAPASVWLTLIGLSSAGLYVAYRNRAARAL